MQVGGLLDLCRMGTASFLGEQSRHLDLDWVLCALRIRFEGEKPFLTVLSLDRHDLSPPIGLSICVRGSRRQDGIENVVNF